MSITVKQIFKALAYSYNSPVRLRSNCICGTNISWGLFSWGEVDFIALSKSFYYTEVEIKVSYSDFVKDKEKKKFTTNKHKKREQQIRYFYYAAPDELAKRILEETEQDVGVLSIIKTPKNIALKILRKSKINSKAKKVTEQEAFKLARLQTFRWFKTL